MVKGSVMVVEDQYHFRKGLVKLIESSQYNWNVVSEASNGQYALKMLEQHQPNLILTDIRMPVMDGIEFVTKVREKYPHTKVIVLSGYRDFEYAQAAIKLGVLDYLVKPCTVEDINQMLRKASQFIEEEAQRAKDKHSEAEGQFLLKAKLSSSETSSSTRATDTNSSRKASSSKQVQPTEDKQQRLINKALAYIELHYADDCRLTEVAGHVKLNPSYFSVLFKKVIGSSYSNYLTTYRLEKALHLLKTTDMKVMEIAAATGFEGANYFTNVFRQVYSLSPKEYRNQHREQAANKVGITT